MVTLAVPPGTPRTLPGLPGRPDPRDKPLATLSPLYQPGACRSLSGLAPAPWPAAATAPAQHSLLIRLGPRPYRPTEEFAFSRLPCATRAIGLSTLAWGGGRVRRAAKRQAAPRLLLKGPHGRACPFAQSLTVAPGRLGGRFLVSVPYRDRKHRLGSLGPELQTLPPSGGSSTSLASLQDSSERPLGAVGRVRPEGTKATQGAAGAAPGMRGGFPPSAPRPRSCSGRRQAPGAPGPTAEVGGVPSAFKCGFPSCMCPPFTLPPPIARVARRVCSPRAP